MNNHQKKQKQKKRVKKQFIKNVKEMFWEVRWDSRIKEDFDGVLEMYANYISKYHKYIVIGSKIGESPDDEYDDYTRSLSLELDRIYSIIFIKVFNQIRKEEHDFEITDKEIGGCLEECFRQLLNLALIEKYNDERLKKIS